MLDVTATMLAMLLLSPIAETPATRPAADGGALLLGEEIPLWAGAAPGSEGLAMEELLTERSQEPSRHDRIFTRIVRPSLRLFRPANPNGAAVIVMPGGAYQRVVVDKEGADICAWLNGLGVTAFILKYRLPDEGHANGTDVPLQDGQRAMRLVRSRAERLGIDPRRIGVIGFSAGGHLAGTLAGYAGAEVYAPRDEADRQSARPDFVILGYPASGPLAAPPPDLAKLPPSRRIIWKYPIEAGVTKDSPPTFIFHASDDSSVSPEGSLRIYQALRSNGVPAEIHIFRSGGHGFGIKDAKGPVALWPTLCGEWLRALGLLNAEKTVEQPQGSELGVEAFFQDLDLPLERVDAGLELEQLRLECHLVEPLLDPIEPLFRPSQVGDQHVVSVSRRSKRL